MQFSVWGISYTDALSLINDLGTHGIDANITPGGIALYPDGSVQVDEMNLICKKHNAVAERGLTPHEETVIYSG